MSNPDTRPLPHGWITLFDAIYNAWFYVNTKADPPVTSWVHPLGAAPARYSPPQGPPPGNGGYGSPAVQQPGSPYPPQQRGGNPPPQQYENPLPQAQGGQGPWTRGGFFQGQQQQQSMHARAQPPLQKQGIRLVSALGGFMLRSVASAATEAIVREAFSGNDGGSFGGDDDGGDAGIDI